MNIIREKDLTADQIYNAVESGLHWKVLPDKTLASGSESSASGSKVSKERITFMPCANANGTCVASCWQGTKATCIFIS